MRTGIFDAILTVAGPVVLVGGVWALAVWALNLSDAQVQWLHRLLSPNQRDLTAHAIQPSMNKPNNDISKLEEH
jgi:hypothetical protein